MTDASNVVPLPGRGPFWTGFCTDSVLLMTCIATMLATVLPFAINNPLWGDEFRTWRDSINVPWQNLVQWQHNRDHAPLSHMLTKLSITVMGSDAPIVMRLPSLVFGALCVGLGYALGASVSGRRMAIMIGLMIAVDANLTWQAQNARMYTMLLAFTLLAILSTHHRWRWGLLIALTLGLWTHYAMLGVIAAVTIVSLWLRDKDAMLAVAGSLLLSLPGLVKLVGMRNRPRLESRNTDPMPEQFFSAVANLAGEKWIAIVLTVVALIGLVLLWWNHRRLLALLGLMLVIGVANILIAGLYRPVDGPRYLTIIQPVIWVGLAWFNLELARRHLLLAIAVAICFTWGVGYQYTRSVVNRQHPWARPFYNAMTQTLPALGFTPGEPLSYHPGEFYIYRPYYDPPRTEKEPPRFMVVGMRYLDQNWDAVVRKADAPDFDPPRTRASIWVVRLDTSPRTAVQAATD